MSSNKSKKCKYFDRGYCKQNKKCSLKHPDKVCEDPNCFNENCDKRHPNPCKYGYRCTFQRKNICMYSHSMIPQCDEDTHKFALKFTKFEKFAKEKFSCLENEIKLLKDELMQKNSQINGLELQINELEKKDTSIQNSQQKKIKDLENIIKQKNLKNSQSTVVNSDLHCDKCDFKTTSRQGLKIHMTRVHSKINFQEFPATCDVCEEILTNENELNIHKKKKHTFHNIRFQCNACDFLANEAETLNVHFGKDHGNNQCGLCDKNFKTSKLLDEHLSKCEILMCANDGCRICFQDLEKMKDHITEKHDRKKRPSYYTYSYWRIHAQDKYEKEVSKKHITIEPDEW